MIQCAVYTSPGAISCILLSQQFFLPEMEQLHHCWHWQQVPSPDCFLLHNYQTGLIIKDAKISALLVLVGMLETFKLFNPKQIIHESNQNLCTEMSVESSTCTKKRFDLTSSFQELRFNIIGQIYAASHSIVRQKAAGFIPGCFLIKNLFIFISDPRIRNSSPIMNGFIFFLLRGISRKRYIKLHHWWWLQKIYAFLVSSFSIMYLQMTNHLVLQRYLFSFQITLQLNWFHCWVSLQTAHSNGDTS